MAENLEIDPIAQYQLGDAVIYKPEGIVAQIVNFKWSKGNIPRITKYALSVGILVEGKHLKRYNGELNQREKRGN